MSIYLWLNAALYLLFAVWCTASPWKTSANLGYETLTAGGRSEYLVIYGGLQLGFAAFFAITARGDLALQKLGVLFALCLYVPIVAYRLFTVAKFWPVPSMTLMVGALELGLLVAAVVLYVASTR
ncbi:MAG: DUF4345 domain-containing protein [Steroidobacteraceae bacterium]